MAEIDPFTLQVLGRAEGKGAVRFEGWLGPPTDATAVETVAAADDDAKKTKAAEAVTKEVAERGFRLFTDRQFTEWLQISSDAILHHIPNAYRDGRSVIWVKREERITRSQSGYAYNFAELEAEAGYTPDDPTARRPRPYP